MGLLGDPVTVAKQLKKMSIQYKIVRHPVPVHSNNLHLIFSRKNISVDIVNEFNKSISVMKNTGELQQILQRYI